MSVSQERLLRWRRLTSLTARRLLPEAHIVVDLLLKRQLRRQATPFQIATTYLLVIHPYHTANT